MINRRKEAFETSLSPRTSCRYLKVETLILGKKTFEKKNISPRACRQALNVVRLNLYKK